MSKLTPYPYPSEIAKLTRSIDISVGQTIRIREWEDMAEEYGLDSDGDIELPGITFFIEAMRKYCGQLVVVDKIYSYHTGTPIYEFTIVEETGFESFNFSPYSIERNEDGSPC